MPSQKWSILRRDRRIAVHLAKPAREGLRQSVRWLQVPGGRELHRGTQDADWCAPYMFCIPGQLHEVDDRSGPVLNHLE